MRTNKQVHGVCSSLRCISISPCADKLPSFPSKAAFSQMQVEKIDFHTTLSSRSQLESSAGKRQLPAQQFQTPRQELRTTLLHGVGMEGSATSEGQNDNFFCRTKVFSKGQQHRLSLSCTHTQKKRRCGNHNYQKLRFECTQVTIVRNRTMESQRVKCSACTSFLNSLLLNFPLFSLFLLFFSLASYNLLRPSLSLLSPYYLSVPLYLIFLSLSLSFASIFLSLALFLSLTLLLVHSVSISSWIRFPAIRSQSFRFTNVLQTRIVLQPSRSPPSRSRASDHCRRASQSGCVTSDSQES